MVVASRREGVREMEALCGGFLLDSIVAPEP